MHTQRRIVINFFDILNAIWNISIFQYRIVEERSNRKILFLIELPFKGEISNILLQMLSKSFDGDIDWYQSKENKHVFNKKWESITFSYNSVNYTLNITINISDILNHEILKFLHINKISIKEVIRDSIQLYNEFEWGGRIEKNIIDQAKVRADKIIESYTRNTRLDRNFDQIKSKIKDTAREVIQAYLSDAENLIYSVFTYKFITSAYKVIMELVNDTNGSVFVNEQNDKKMTLIVELGSNQKNRPPIDIYFQYIIGTDELGLIIDDNFLLPSEDYHNKIAFFISRQFVNHPSLESVTIDRNQLKRLHVKNSNDGSKENKTSFSADLFGNFNYFANNGRSEVQSLFKPNESFDCTLFSPPVVIKSDTFYIQLFVHFRHKINEIIEAAKNFDAETVKKGRATLKNIENGERLTFHIEIKNIEVDEPLQFLIWNEISDSVVFEINVPENFSHEHLTGKVTITIDENYIPIGHIRFKINVTERIDNKKVKLENNGTIKWYNFIFISYASKDRDEVMKRIQMLKLLKYQFFKDILYLKPGDNWEEEIFNNIERSDAFFLFWSSAACNSKWVKKEYTYALKKKNNNEENPPEILPIIIEHPPPKPPEELKYLHFNDSLLPFLKTSNART